MTYSTTRVAIITDVIRQPHGGCEDVHAPRLLIITAAETTSTTTISAGCSSSTAIPTSAGSTARRLGARARNVANLTTAIAFRCSAASASAASESTGAALRLGAVARLMLKVTHRGNGVR